MPRPRPSALSPVPRHALAACLRHDVLYRTAHDVQGQPLHVGCGFMLKPNPQGAYHDRLLPSLVVVCLLRGQGRYRDSLGRWHDVHAGHAMVMPPRRPHSVAHEPDGQWAEFYFVLPQATYDHMVALAMLPADLSMLRFDTGPATLERFEQLHTLTRTLPDAELPAIWAQGQCLLADIVQRHRQGHARLSPTRRQILEACRLLADRLDRRVSAQAVAAQVGMGYELFRKRFQQETGLSPGAFRIRRRMELARKLIADQQLSNKEVAYRLGYADPFTFSKQFLRHTGQSPSAFRRSV